ncbi:MAG: hypothetical protein GX892_12130 [Thermoanaerobacteraceae bacterium]|nr:hypothetical protein [Thermoanaerobacteraceae bacterium]
MFELEILRMRERVEMALEIGESHFREFKSSFEGPPGNKKMRDIKELCSDIARTLVAFANADGGELYVGIEDDSTITGVAYTDDQIKYIIESPELYVHKSTPLPSLKKKVVNIDDKKVLYFSVTKGINHVYITSDGKCLQRKDLESVPIPPEEIELSRQEQVSREYDRQFVDSASLSDLDIDLINSFSRELYRISAEKFLQYLELGEFVGERIRLKRAALLLFSNNPNRWHPRLQVRVIKVNGTELLSGEDYNVVIDDEVSDCIVKLIEKGWELIRPHLVETKFSTDALFRTQVMYPELACKEALINAIAHRDYSVEGRGVEVYIFTDRIEFVSPGELLSSIKIDDIIKQKGVHQSRNTLIARTLREIGYMRELGEGFKRIFKLLDDNELMPPELISTNNFFKVVMHQKTVYTKEEKLWLENFSHIPLTRDEKTVVRMGCYGKLLSPQAIWDTVGIVDTDYYRQILESLKKKGLLISKVSKSEAMSIAKAKNINKKSVPRFLVQLPQKVQKDIVENHEFDDDSDYEKLYICNLPYETDESEICDLFSKYGEVVSVSLPINRETSKPRGFAFVEFDKRESAEKAFNDRKNIYLKGRKIYIQRYKRSNYHLSTNSS